MAAHLAGVIDGFKISREFALLGNYENALAHYEGVKRSIESYLRSERPSVRFCLAHVG